jgi:hypothetical protein
VLFPTFHVVRNELLLEELTMVTEAPAPALYSAPPDNQAPSGGQAPRPTSTGVAARPPPAAPRPASTADRGRRFRKGDRGGGGPTRGGPFGRGGG